MTRVYEYGRGREEKPEDVLCNRAIQIATMHMHQATILDRGTSINNVGIAPSALEYLSKISMPRADCFAHFPPRAASSKELARCSISP